MPAVLSFGSFGVVILLLLSTGMGGGRDRWVPLSDAPDDVCLIYLFVLAGRLVHSDQAFCAN
jgi:hypothetical protein